MKRFLTFAALCAVASTAVAGVAQAGPHSWHDHSDYRKGGWVAHNDWDHAEQVDWHAHHLRKPPRGYEWRHVNGNYVLAAVATGAIVSLLADH